VKILGIDTATQLCGVAILDTDSGRWARRQQAVTMHSETLLALLSECLTELSLTPQDLGAVALGAGPGSFTGLRIGCATAKGLCYALSIPLVMVSSLRALAQPLCGQGSVLAAQDAFRGQVYVQLVPSQQPSAALAEIVRTHPQLLTDAAWRPDELGAMLRGVTDELWSCGGGIARYPELGLSVRSQRPEDNAPDPLVVAQLGLELLKRGQTAHLASALPTYVTVSAAEEQSASSIPVASESAAWTR
jgi:tRNA threonylcarbamoyl adenosine modification protein YeaZ